MNRPNSLLTALSCHCGDGSAKNAHNHGSVSGHRRYCSGYPCAGAKASDNRTNEPFYTTEPGPRAWANLTII